MPLVKIVACFPSCDCSSAMFDEATELFLNLQPLQQQRSGPV